MPNNVSIQVFGSGSSANLTTTTITPKTSTQTYSPSSSYDGYSSVTVNGDSNLISSNIVSRKSIFGVSGSYSPVPLISHRMPVFTAYCYSEGDTGYKAWYLSGTIPENDYNSIFVDLNRVAAVHLWRRYLPHESGYDSEYILYDIVENVQSRKISFFSYPYIAIKNTSSKDNSCVYFQMCAVPTDFYIDVNTRQFKFPLSFNYDGALTEYFKESSFDWGGRDFRLYTY